MPLSPAQVDALIATASDKNFTTLCHEIDELLVDARRVRKTPVTVGVRDLPADFIQEAIRTYEAIGWRVKLVYDDRDGNFLSFERT